MEVFKLTQEESDLMRKRQAYFSAIARKYTCFEDFIRENGGWFAIMGVKLYADGRKLGIYILLDYLEYEEYYVIRGDDGRLTVSDVIGWQDNCCSNILLNIFTEEEADEEDIFRCRRGALSETRRPFENSP